ncbi:beta strand repeat-containing protein [Flavobacterium sp. XS1P32]|uniref:beta strand repeat-containing protein n=1 Tax=Flavobacterium sp. XS1P32 TaxID=3401726 RepID=UPI003AABCEEB
MKKTLLNNVLFVLLTFLGLSLSSSLNAQTTYTWNQTGSASFGLAANWSPSRDTPAANDILVFNNGATTTVTDVPAQIIGGLTVATNTNVTLNTSATPAKILTITNGLSGADFSVESGSQLNVAITGGAFPLTIAIGTGATGIVAGSMTFSSATVNTINTITAADASGLIFTNGAILTQSTNSTGGIFGSGTSNSVLFASGSTFIQAAGSNPFQKTQPASVVVFQTGSLFKIIGNISSAFSGRTYPNLEIAATGYNQSPTGGAVLSIDNLTITTGILNMNLTSAVSIKGNISVATGQTLTFSPATAVGSLTFNGTTAQTINNAGTLTFTANTNAIIANTNGVTFNQSQTLLGSTTVNAGATLATNGTLTLSGTPSINGTLRLNSTGLLAGATPTYGAASSLVYNGVIGGANVGNEWTGNATIAGVGIPNNVTLNSSSININSNRGLAGNLTVDSGSTVTVKSGNNLSVANSLFNNGTESSFVLENNANLIQNGTTNTNTGAITINRSGALLMLLDYSLWSSPVSGQKLKAFSPNTLDNRFYTYNPSSNIYVAVAAPATTDFALGNGYLIRVPNDHPTTPTTWNGMFKGVPNNGDITITGLTPGTFNAVGNPYPSTISADAFITANSITEPLYFWRKTNAAAGTAYATYTMAGAVGTPGNGGITPNGTIQVGQGFIVKTVSNSVAFTNNNMRTANNSNQILRTAKTEKNRIWLNLSKGTEYVNQMMVAYMDGATSEIDNTLDGRYINDNQTALTSSLKGEEFVIQAKGLPFDSSDIVPLSFKAEQAGSFAIDLDHVDGLFLGNQEIILKDLKAGIEQNLKAGSYTFTSDTGTFKNRFEVTFKTSQTLDVNSPSFDENSVVIFNQNGSLNVSSSKNTIKNIRVFDIRGVLIAEQKEVNANTASIKNVTASKQTVLIQITSDDNKTVTKKAIF